MISLCKKCIVLLFLTTAIYALPTDIVDEDVQKATQEQDRLILLEQKRIEYEEQKKEATL